MVSAIALGKAFQDQRTLTDIQYQEEPVVKLLVI